MKQCPNCKTTYTDDSMTYCLTDGATLIGVSDAAETVNMSFGSQPMRVNIPQNSAPTVFAAPQNFQPQPQSQRSNVGLIIAGILGLLLLLVIGGVAAYFLLSPADDKKVVAVNSPTPNASPSVASGDDTAKLKEQMANLQKQLEDQKNQKSNQTANVSSTPPKQMQRTARVNSPGDGFLALRSEPNSETGYRIAQIPHGATVTVLGCPRSSNVGRMAGHWCQVVYNGQSGWAFDAFMIF